MMLRVDGMKRLERIAKIGGAERGATCTHVDESGRERIEQ